MSDTAKEEASKMTLKGLIETRAPFVVAQNVLPRGGQEHSDLMNFLKFVQSMRENQQGEQKNIGQNLFSPKGKRHQNGAKFLGGGT